MNACLVVLMIAGGLAAALVLGAMILAARANRDAERIFGQDGE